MVTTQDVPVQTNPVRFRRIVYNFFVDHFLGKHCGFLRKPICCIPRHQHPHCTSRIPTFSRHCWSFSALEILGKQTNVKVQNIHFSEHMQILGQSIGFSIICSSKIHVNELILLRKTTDVALFGMTLKRWDPRRWRTSIPDFTAFPVRLIPQSCHSPFPTDMN